MGELEGRGTPVSRPRGLDRGGGDRHAGGVRRRAHLWGWVALLGASAVAQPQAPELTLEGESGARFEFARIPELVLIRGIAQIAQLGFYQVDPNNRWPPGDVEHASKWLSNRPTRLVDATTGQPVVSDIVTYGERSGELGYNGTWSGDVTVRIKEIGGTAQSDPFRIRVLTPTVVWGANAAAVNSQKGWNARVCLGSFATCRSSNFVGGGSDVAPLVVFITPGTYGSEDWYIGTRRFIYVLGDPGTRPTLIGDVLGGTKKQMFYIANLNMRDSHISHSGALRGAPNIMIVRNVYQCCETRDRNGLMNPATGTLEDRWEVYWHASEARGMGGVGNTTHPAYVEGRPNSIFDVNNVRILGSRGSSGIKTTMNELNVRHSVLQVAESLDEIQNGVCVHPGSSTGCLMHTPIDFPGFTAATIYGNQFTVWRGPTQGVPAGRSGVLSGTMFIRHRANSLGSDTPNYPNTSWNPPVSTQSTKLQGFCNQWSPEATTFVADKFWKDVRKVPLASETNPCTFKHYVSFNHFIQVPGSLPVFALRDDGTFPAKAAAQFDVNMIILRNHPLWAERSTSFLFGNTYEGFGATQRKYRLDFQPHIKSIEPLAYWPRSGPDEYPRVVDDLGEELPPWFKL